MRMNMNALNALRLKLAEYSKENGAIAEHVSLSMNRFCFDCAGNCRGLCAVGCGGACASTCIGTSRSSMIPQSDDISGS